ncbi:sensor histidine kinase [Cellulosimicrobium sp. NPDC057127]|uniref:sensor histidine kinase n=1 Tax=Cellulosimicrobium sp. NPDC057127 TaxID=3346026 RepID=UPI00362B259F
MTTAPALTETQVRRRGPVGRLVADRPWVADVALAVGVLLLGLVTASLALMTVEGSTGLGLFPRDAPVATTVMTAWLAGAGLGAALLGVRRVWPLATTAVLTVLAVVSLATAGVLGVVGVCLACAVYTVAATRPARTAWIACAAVFGVVSVALWWWQDIGLAEMLLWSDPTLAQIEDPPHQLVEPAFSGGRRSASVSLLLALLLLGVAAGSGVRARRLHARDLVERYAAMARERDQSAALARAAERARIAREMHDVVAHSVSVMVALSDGAGAALDRAPDRSREALRELSRTGRSALADMQGVLGALDPGAGGENGTGETLAGPTGSDLETVVERFRAAGVPVTATGLDALHPADTSVRLAVVRIVTEGLTNVLRHAPGATTEVAVRRTAAGLEVDVLDTGSARPGTGGGSGRGVLGMRERAALLGGHVEAGPRSGGGWRVHVVLPSQDATAGSAR